MLQKGRGVLQSPSRSPVFSHQKEHMKHNRMIETQESIRLAVIGISQCHPFLISVSGSRLPQRPVACAIELVSRSAPTPGAGSLWNQPLRWGGPSMPSTDGSGCDPAAVRSVAQPCRPVCGARNQRRLWWFGTFLGLLLDFGRLQHYSWQAGSSSSRVRNGPFWAGQASDIITL